MTGYRSTCTARELKLPQFKFNKLFNEDFPKLFFFKIILSGKNWRGGGEWLLKNSAMK